MNATATKVKKVRWSRTSPGRMDFSTTVDGVRYEISKYGDGEYVLHREIPEAQRMGASMEPVRSAPFTYGIGTNVKNAKHNAALLIGGLNAESMDWKD